MSKEIVAAAVALCILFGLMGWAIWWEYNNPCLEKQLTGRTTCTTHNYGTAKNPIYITRCSPEEKCVRRGKR